MSTRAEVVEEGAKVSRIITWLLYFCIKPETSEINVTKVFPWQKHKYFLCFLWELWAARSLLGSVYLGPGWDSQ